MDSPECCLSHLPGRQGEGLRIYWGSPEQQSLLSRWNPWSTEVPYATFTEHPVKYTSEKFLEICKAGLFPNDLRKDTMQHHQWSKSEKMRGGKYLLALRRRT
ncbi:tumor protein p63-regulated gene 1 protein isoform X2 [Physeter macrocephalus]|uniref:Tumor protein p63-regulated gene 1 protein isoform X2 n=1 Tax=Physeter macrocephalus TaxID=9755 RepID=A0A455BGQ3_PHYMC|nr:tumor protein p63-regulated gene 1 protein isoform X2 [Physeter catodon]|eukprot:XP_028347989.1 tumor protein p63-regulated gene 1 protein isoform X4 [Physeter catodon]